MIKAKKMKKAEGGTVIVLTLAGLAAILGVIGLAIDLGLMFDYKQRAQMAADAGALAAALSPTESTLIDRELAAQEMSKANGFEHGVGSIAVTLTEPQPGDYKVTVKESYPTYFLQMIGIKTFPIEARAVARGGGTGGDCMMVGVAATKTDLQLNAPPCTLYFSSLKDKKGIIDAEQIIITDTPPLAPGTFPYDKFTCSKDDTFTCCEVKKGKDCDGATLKAGCYKKINVKGTCTFGVGPYYIVEELKFEENAIANGSGVTFFLNTKSDLVFDGQVRDCLGTILPLKFNFPLIYRASDYCRFAEATIGQRRKKSVPRSI